MIEKVKPRIAPDEHGNKFRIRIQWNVDDAQHFVEERAVPAFREVGAADLHVLNWRGPIRSLHLTHSRLSVSARLGTTNDISQIGQILAPLHLKLTA